MGHVIAIDKKKSGTVGVNSCDQRLMMVESMKDRFHLSARLRISTSGLSDTQHERKEANLGGETQ